MRIVVEETSSGSGGGAAAAGSVTIGSAASSKAVTFANSFGSTNYSPVFSITNTADATPIFLDGFISALSATGFTVTFNAPTDTANYVLNYAIFSFA